ncbi:MAG TPA: hypothetical protein VI997_10320, partial [Candidatus Thermoplasmatota archaeon]|nr:hypothetical protein [Candidatus Thermoplasmatota archaeon]
HVLWYRAASVVASGGLPAAEGLRASVHERLFPVLLAEVHLLTGVAWLDILQYGPALVSGFLAFSVYALLRPSPTAVPATFLVALVPSTARFLGPAYLVPSAVALASLPAVLILVLDEGRARRGRLALAGGLTLAAFFLHLVVGAVVALALGLALVTTKAARSEWAIALSGVAALAVVALVATPQELVLLASKEVDRAALELDASLFDRLGRAGLALWALGAAIVVWRPERAGSPAVEVFAGLSVALLGLVAWTIAVAPTAYVTYDRLHAPFFLAAGVVVADLVVRLARGAAALVGRVQPRARGALAGAGAAVVVLGLLTAGLTAQFDEDHGRILHDDDWKRILWMRDNLGPEHRVFLSDPYLAGAVAATTGMRPAALHTAGVPVADRYDAADRSGTWLLERGISVVVGTVGQPHDERFAEVYPAVWAAAPGTSG